MSLALKSFMNVRCYGVMCLYYMILASFTLVVCNLMSCKMAETARRGTNGNETKIGTSCSKSRSKLANAMPADSKAENEAQDVIDSLVACILLLLCWFCLLASLRHAHLRYKSKKNNHTNHGIKLPDVLTPSSIACFIAYSATLFTLTISIWVFERCKAQYSWGYIRVGTTFYFLGKYLMYV